MATDWLPSAHDVAFRAEEAERRAAARAWRAAKGLDALPPDTLNLHFDLVPGDDTRRVARFD